MSDRAYGDLQRRARLAEPPMFSSKAIARRLASVEQRRKAQQI